MLKQREIVGLNALKISDVVLQLSALQKEHGDVRVFITDETGDEYPLLDVGFRGEEEGEEDSLSIEVVPPRILLLPYFP